MANTKINYSEMTNASKKMKKYIENIIDNSDYAESLVNALDNETGWDGKAYNEYKKNFNNLVTAVKNCCNDLLILSNTLNTVVANYKAVDAKVMASLGSFSISK